MAEQEGEVDLAGAGLVSAGIVGELDMADPRQAARERRGELAFGSLRVVDVVLDERIGGADVVEDGDRLARAVQIEAGDVEGVDRLGQEIDARAPRSSPTSASPPASSGARASIS